MSSSRGKQKCMTAFFGNSSSKPTRKRPRSGGSFRSQNGGSGFGICPLCQVSFAWHVLESHASECNGNSEITAVDTSNHSKVESVNVTTPPKALLQTKTSEITTSKSVHTQITPCKKEEIEKTKAVATNTSNIVKPRLAPIFQLQKENTTNDNSPNAMKTNAKLRPHSYEPIPGLFVYENFITEEEEALIMEGCVNHVLPPWKHCRFNGKHIGKRWGVHCNLRDRRVDAPEHPLPEVLSKIIFPKLQQLGLPATKNFWPNEANAIDYYRQKGHWLQAHVDDRKLSKEAIANLSLMGDCYMTFRNVSKHRNLAVAEQRVLLKRRCLQVLTGKARYDFSHGIANADLLSPRRISITMRESPLTRAKRKTTGPVADNTNAIHV